MNNNKNKLTYYKIEFINSDKIILSLIIILF